MRTLSGAAIVLLAVAAPQAPLFAHTIQYEVLKKGIAVRVYYTAKDPAAYSSYEVFGPGDAEAYQTGRTDRNGYLAFLPDRPGTWTIKVWGESTHGFHGVALNVEVDRALALVSYSRPLVAVSTKLITGLSIIFGLFGIFAWLRARKGAGTPSPSP